MHKVSPSWLKKLLVCAAMLLLSACVQQVEVKPELAEAKPPIGPTASELAEQKKQRQIKYYLFNAYQALENGRLMRPKNDNAYDWFSQALWLDSRNAEAHRGMREIGKTYLQLAEEAYRSEDRSRAELMLERALWVSAAPADVQAIKARYPKPVMADNEFKLSKSDLSQKSQQLLDQLSELAEQAKTLPSRLLIVARSDKEGRWIYKQMRNSVEGYRLRGNIKVGQTPKIVLIDMPLKQSNEMEQL